MLTHRIKSQVLLCFVELRRSPFASESRVNLAGFSIQISRWLAMLDLAEVDDPHSIRNTEMNAVFMGSESGYSLLTAYPPDSDISEIKSLNWRSFRPTRYHGLAIFFLATVSFKQWSIQ
jgi:hypothetical protein